jgi:hypothetical protein
VNYSRESFERNHLRRIIWERSFESNHLRKIIWEKRSGREIFNKRERNEILRQTTRLLRISINKTCLFVHVLSQFSQYSVSFLLIKYFFSAFSLLKWFLSNDFLQMISFKWSLSNDLFQMISLKWFSRIIFANNLF